MSRPNLKSVHAAIASRGDVADIHIQAYHPLNKGFYKVVAAVSNIKTEDDLAVAIARVTDGGARFVPGSAVMDGRIVAAVVASNVRSKPMDESFSMVTACTARDTGGNIWNVVNDGSGKRVIQESADDLEAMLAERVASRKVVANVLEGRSVSTASWQNGDLVRYVNLETSKVDCGLAFHTKHGVSVVSPRGEVAGVTPAAIMESVPAKQLGQGARDLHKSTAGTQLTVDELEQAIAYLGRAGILSDAMADRMYALSRTPQAGAGI